MYASNYLQEHLLTLPSLPTHQQLMEIKERRETAAQERLAEIEQQREEQRRLNAKHEAAAASDKATSDIRTDRIAEGFGKFTSDMDRLFSMETIKDISKELHSIIPGSAKESAGRQEVGWMCDSDAVAPSHGNPFMVQRDQLLSFIAQARDAKRFDEVRALEESLRDIEAAMQGQHESYQHESYQHESYQHESYEHKSYGFS